MPGQDKKVISHTNHAVPLPQKKWWETRSSKIAGIILSAVAIVTLVVWFIAFRPYVSTDDARIAATTVKVANLGASGQVMKILVTEGDFVSKGQVIVELDKRTAEAQLEKAKARAHYTSNELLRTGNLASQQGTSQRELDRARAEAQGAAAELQLAEIAVERTCLKSPVDGVVIQKTADEGNVLEGNQTAVIIADLDHAWVSANIEETSVKRVKDGQAASISIDEGGTLTGKVIDVRGAAASAFSMIPADNASGNFIKVVQRIPVKIQLDPHLGKKLRVGQSVVVRIKVR